MESMSSSDSSLVSKAWIYYEQGPLTQTLQQTSISLDAPLDPNELIVEVKAVALNPADIQIGNLP